MLISWWPCLFCSRAVTRVLLAAVSVCVRNDLHLHSGVGFSLFANLAFFVFFFKASKSSSLADFGSRLSWTEATIQQHLTCTLDK